MNRVVAFLGIWTLVGIAASVLMTENPFRDTQGSGPKAPRDTAQAIPADSLSSSPAPSSPDPSSTHRDPYPPTDRVLATNVSGGWLNVDFLIANPDSALAEARRCVRSRPQSSAVSCYGFTSREARRASDPIAAGNYRGFPCWTARFTRNKRGQESGDTGTPALMAGCPQEPDTTGGEPPVLRADSAAGDSLRVRLVYEVRRDARGRFQIVGRTNLPDGTDLSMSVSRGMFLAQDQTVVDDGTFKSAWFSQGGQGFPPGKWEVGVTVPMATSQPDSVTAVLGPDNANMVGPLVELADSEHPILGKVASRDTVIVIK